MLGDTGGVPGHMGIGRGSFVDPESIHPLSLLVLGLGKSWHKSLPAHLVLSEDCTLDDNSGKTFTLSLMSCCAPDSIQICCISVTSVTFGFISNIEIGFFLCRVLADCNGLKKHDCVGPV